MVKIILEDWQVKNLREYFGYNDKTQTEHWAYDVFNKAYKEQCTIPIVVKSLPQDRKEEIKTEIEMSKKAIITGFSNAGAKGVTLHLNEKTSLKTGNLKSDNFWVSWDKIGELLFDNYTNEESVSGRDKLRGKS